MEALDFGQFNLDDMELSDVSQLSTEVDEEVIEVIKIPIKLTEKEFNFYIIDKGEYLKYFNIDVLPKEETFWCLPSCDEVMNGFNFNKLVTDVGFEDISIKVKDLKEEITNTMKTCKVEYFILLKNLAVNMQ